LASELLKHLVAQLYGVRAGAVAVPGVGGHGVFPVVPEYAFRDLVRLRLERQVLNQPGQLFFQFCRVHFSPP